MNAFFKSLICFVKWNEESYTFKNFIIGHKMKIDLFIFTTFKLKSSLEIMKEAGRLRH